MKNLINRLLLVMALVTAIGFMASSQGCKAPPSDAQVAYNTLDTIGASVDAAMKVAASLKTNGKLADADWQKIVTIHDQQFLPSYRVACDVAGAATDKAIAPNSLVSVANDLIALVNSFNK